MANLIEQWEGFKSTAYKCPAGKWTIGYGTTIYSNGNKVKEGDTITRAQALIELYAYLEALEPILEPLNLTANQREALQSFAYNVGVTAFKHSTLLKLIRRNAAPEDIKAEFLKWSNGGGRRIQGLYNRRVSEATKYFS
jgi:lysozyme